MFNGPFSGTTQVSRYQKGKTNLDFTEARNSEWQWHQLGHMQVSTSLQTDMQVAVAQFFTGPMPFLPPNQQRQSTEGKCTLMYIKQKMQNDISTNHHIQNVQIRNSSLAATSSKIHHLSPGCAIYVV